MHSTSQTISKTASRIPMDESKSKIRIELNLGGKAVTLNVPAGEENMFRAAAKFVDKRVEEYKSFVDTYGAKTGHSMVALEFLLDKLRLQNAMNDSLLANKVSEIVGRIDEALED